MRELKVVGIASGGRYVELADPHSDQHFRVSVDDKLRAAIRGDVAAFGQIEIETDGTLRPKEIQARIRAGASVEQIAAMSGMQTHRVESFAYPVLVERARVAERAKKGHPVRDDGGITKGTIEAIVKAAFRERGLGYETAEWDAFKGAEGWVLSLQWTAGRTANAAHWRWQTDAHGGTITPLDDTAKAMLNPEQSRPLRGLTAVREEAVAEPEPTPEPEVEETPVAEEVAETQPAPQPQRSTSPKKGKPTMPSWEDVLLGVRSASNE